ncbi:MAG: hypothetical protein DWQ37_19335 [Planctomycetota bacterium]|nr:MAG: hypothetical protein DWQ37_19335 [Planctomycetota bacterium]
MTVAIQALCLISLLFAAWVIVGNWYGVIHACVTKRSFSSLPILGGLLGALAFLAFETLRPFWWVPLVADIGCVPVLALTLLYLTTRRLRG